MAGLLICKCSSYGRQVVIYRGQWVGVFFEEELDKYLLSLYLVVMKGFCDTLELTDQTTWHTTAEDGNHCHFREHLTSYIISVRDFSFPLLNFRILFVYKFLTSVSQYV
jgi:hypothetical protein